ncbi:hypothetical protein [Avibacterium gallinarum]|uniref:hypothetical protein n=1 Tax=Avibacterium gallinarum TaxID=755 RepID=UPI0013FE4C99|nr:hypothetical protein [Avibacterium gallinarum]
MQSKVGKRQRKALNVTAGNSPYRVSKANKHTLAALLLFASSPRSLAHPIGSLLKQRSKNNVFCPHSSQIFRAAKKEILLRKITIFFA